MILVKNFNNCVVIGLVLCFFTALRSLSAQQITFQKIYPRTNGESYGLSIVQTEDNGYMLSTSGYQCMRLNKLGDSIWANKVNGGYNILKTNDHNFIFTTNYPITKFDINGNIIYQTLIFNNSARTFCISRTYDRGFILCGVEIGATKGYAYALKTDSSGNFEWQKTYPYYFYWSATQILQSDQTSFMFTGTDSGAYIIKTDLVGNMTLYRNYSQIINESDFLLKLEDGFIIGGHNGIIKIDIDGNVIWYKLYNMSPNREMYFRSIVRTNDGGFAITGEKDTTAGFENLPMILLLKTDSQGNQLWYKMYGTNSDYNSGLDLKQTSDSGYIMTGITFGNSSGKRKELPTGDLIVVKTDYKGNCPLVNVNNYTSVIITDFSLDQNYPNPFNNSTIIKYTLGKKYYVKLLIYDVLGNVVNKVVEKLQGSGEYKVNFDGVNLSTGIYFLRLQVSDINNGSSYFVKSKKILILK